MEEPGRLQSMGSLRVGRDWATSLSLFSFMYWRRKWQPTPVFFPEKPRDGGAWWASIYGVAQSPTRLKRLNSSSSSSAGSKLAVSFALISRWILSPDSSCFDLSSLNEFCLGIITLPCFPFFFLPLFFVVVVVVVAVFLYDSTYLSLLP